MYRFLILFAVGLSLVDCGFRNLQLTNDQRIAIEVSHFGFRPGGQLTVGFDNLTYPDFQHLTNEQPVGFSFTQGEEVLEYTKSNPADCFLLAPPDVKQSAPGVIGLFDFVDRSVRLVQTMPGLRISSDHLNSSATNDTFPFWSTAYLSTIGDSFAFNMKIDFISAEGYFVFMFHNCRHRSIFDDRSVGVSFHLSLVEKNADSYFSVGDENAPKMYFIFSCIFLAYFGVWCCLLRRDRQNAHKIHYLMGAVILLKSMSVLLHGINLYYKGQYGKQLEAWAVLYYIFHLIKGSLLFTTIVLIGTGWTLFKNFLVQRDRRLLMIIIPLQVLDNIAMMVMSETEIALISYEQWSRVFILFDLACCAAVILPILWSIKHLEQASRTDGKAVFSLQKLRLFQQFYIIVICYVYLTRIIKYLVQFTIPFKFMWITTLIEEAGAAVFFFWTGMKFKPARDNPYLRLSQSDDDEDNYALTQCGALEDVIFLSKKHKEKDKNDQQATATDEAL